MNLFDLCVKISIDTSEADTGIAKVSQSGEKASKSLGSKLVSAGKTAAKGLAVVSGAATAVVGGLLAVESSTEEYRIAQGKLNTAFEAAGMGANVAQQAYKSFYGILGDTDTATEASQLLAELALNEQDVTTWTNIAAGVFGRWGDSIPIEGLIEASNETAKVGQVTGVLADALNWAGISEDEFNKKLASCSSESERNKMIMEALSGEYGEAAKAFYENNEALVSSRYASNDVTDAMSKIGKAVSEVKTKFLNELVPALASAAPQIANAISSIDVSSLVNGFSDFVTFVINNGPMIVSAIAGIGTAFATWKVTSLISGIASSLTTLFVPAMTAANTAQERLNIAMKANVIGAIITLVVSLVSFIVTLWTTNEGFRDAVGAIWEAIKGFFLSAKDAIVNAWSTVKDFFSGVWEGIKGAFSAVKEFFSERFQQARQASEAAWDGISSFFSGVWEGIKGVFSTVKNFFSEKFTEARDASESAWDNITTFFSGVWEDIKGVFSKAWDEFKKIGSNIVNGIKDGISSAWNGLTSWFNGLWDSLFGNRTANVTVNKRVVGGADGSHASGLNYVPWDGYLAELHRGEMVLTKQQAEAYRNMELPTQRVNFSSSAIGLSSAGIINGISSAFQNGIGDQSITINLMMPDGSKMASYILDPLAKYAKANGTPIINPA